MTFKVGDRVRLTGKLWGEELGYTVGTEVVIADIDHEGPLFYESSGEPLYVYEGDLASDWGGELVTDDEIDEPNDNINHPSHYTSYKGIEVIQLTEQMSFNRGNAVKYISRAGLKNPETEIEDLEKSAWYINREIQRLKDNA